MFYKVFGCSHQWKKESEVILPSAHEQTMKGVTSFKSGAGTSIPHWFFTKTHILILSCTECGKIYKSVEESKL